MIDPITIGKSVKKAIQSLKKTKEILIPTQWTKKINSLNKRKLKANFCSKDIKRIKKAKSETQPQQLT